MITAIVSAIEGPILFVVSGCLGESRMQRLWLWNLVPTQANMPSSDVSWKLPSIMFGFQSFFIIRAFYAEQWLGDETWTCSL